MQDAASHVEIHSRSNAPWTFPASARKARAHRNHPAHRHHVFPARDLRDGVALDGEEQRHPRHPARREHEHGRRTHKDHVVVSVTETGQLYLDKRELSQEQLVAELRQAERAGTRSCASSSMATKTRASVSPSRCSMRRASSASARSPSRRARRPHRSRCPPPPASFARPPPALPRSGSAPRSRSVCMRACSSCGASRRKSRRSSRSKATAWKSRSSSLRLRTHARTAPEPPKPEPPPPVPEPPPPPPEPEPLPAAEAAGNGASRASQARLPRRSRAPPRSRYQNRRAPCRAADPKPRQTPRHGAGGTAALAPARVERQRASRAASLRSSTRPAPLIRRVPRRRASRASSCCASP